MEVYKEFPFLVISWDNENKIVVMDWKGGFVRNEQLKQGLDDGLECLKVKKAVKWLGNTKEMGVFGAEAQKWINEDWFPRFLATGVKYMAVIIPGDALAKMSVESVVSTVAGTGLTTHYFDNSQAAHKWLKDSK